MMGNSELDFNVLVQELQPGAILSVPPDVHHLFLLSLDGSADPQGNGEGLPSEEIIAGLRVLAQALFEIAERLEDVRSTWFSIDEMDENDELAESQDVYDDVVEKSFTKIEECINGIRGIENQC